MPCYDFKCTTCNEIFTVTRSMSDSSQPECIKCHSREHVQRVWSCVNLGGMTNKSSSSGCGSCSGGSCSTCG